MLLRYICFNIIFFLSIHLALLGDLLELPMRLANTSQPPCCMFSIMSSLSLGDQNDVRRWSWAWAVARPVSSLSACYRFIQCKRFLKAPKLSELVNKAGKYSIATVTQYSKLLILSDNHIFLQIIIKWLVFSPEPGIIFGYNYPGSYCAPSLLIGLINMFMMKPRKEGFWNETANHELEHCYLQQWYPIQVWLNFNSEYHFELTNFRAFITFSVKISISNICIYFRVILKSYFCS